MANLERVYIIIYTREQRLSDLAAKVDSYNQAVNDGTITSRKHPKAEC